MTEKPEKNKMQNFIFAKVIIISLSLSLSFYVSFSNDNVYIFLKSIFSAQNLWKTKLFETSFLSPPFPPKKYIRFLDIFPFSNNYSNNWVNVRHLKKINPTMTFTSTKSIAYFFMVKRGRGGEHATSLAQRSKNKKKPQIVKVWTYYKRERERERKNNNNNNKNSNRKFLNNNSGRK